MGNTANVAAPLEKNETPWHISSASIKGRPDAVVFLNHNSVTHDLVWRCNTCVPSRNIWESLRQRSSRCIYQWTSHLSGSDWNANCGLSCWGAHKTCSTIIMPLPQACALKIANPPPEPLSPLYVLHKIQRNRYYKHSMYLDGLIL